MFFGYLRVNPIVYYEIERLRGEAAVGFAHGMQ